MLPELNDVSLSVLEQDWIFNQNSAWENHKNTKESLHISFGDKRSSALATLLLTCAHASVGPVLTPSLKTTEMRLSAGTTIPQKQEAGESGLSQSMCSQAQLGICHTGVNPFSAIAAALSKSKAKTSFTKVTEMTGSE